MREADIEEAFRLMFYKRQVENMIGSIQTCSTFFVNMTYRQDPEQTQAVAIADLHAGRFFHFLEGELQAIKLEMRELGVET